MQAIQYHAYGGPEVLRVEDVPVPEPGPNQVRLRVKAASINPYEFHFVRGEPHFMRAVSGLRKPKNKWLGRDVAGIVDAIGANVTRFEIGDEVYGSADGSYAEYALAPENKLAPRPNCTWEAAAALPMCAYTGLQGLDAANVQPGMDVLVNGGSGGIGHLTIQMANAMGANVWATCKTENKEWVEALGATVIDYTKDDFRNYGPFDAIIDTVASHSFGEAKTALKPNGKYVWLGAAKMGKIIGPMLQIFGIKLFGRGKGIVVESDSTPEHLDRIRAWVNEGALQVRIEQTLPLAEVSMGLAHVEAGHTKGKTVIVP